MIRVFDDFLPVSVREDALRASYGDLQAHDGETYKRVAVCDVPGLVEALEARLGSVEMLGMGYRLNYAGEPPNHAIHSDIGWGTHAAVVYLSEGEGGTAFWRHRATLARKCRDGDLALFDSVKDDWDDSSKWGLRMMVPMKLGRAVVYESELFHSRYPFEAFGDCPENGRLIAVAFFNLKAH